MPEKWVGKDALFKSPKKKERHTIEGLGDVWIHSLTCGQKDEYETAAYQVMEGTREVKMHQARALLILWTVHDQHGNRLFADADLGKVAAMDSWIAEPLYTKARRLSRMTAADMDELVKNSGTIRSDGSVSGLQPPSDGPAPGSTPS